MFMWIKARYLINMIRPIFFLAGLMRCTKITRSGAILASKRTVMLNDKYPGLTNHFLGIPKVMLYLYRDYFKAKCLYSANNMRGMVFCGGSENNIKEFRYFGELVKVINSSALYSENKNFYYVKKELLVKSYKIRVLRILFSFIILAFFLRYKSNPTLMSIAIKYAKHYEFTLLSVINNTLKPDIAIVSNDHTDFNVAFSTVMKGFSVPRVYIQHAEISNLFPCLDFDYSILRNQRSVDIYKKIGPLKGKVYVLPRKDVCDSCRNILRAEGESVSIVIYLSSVFDHDAVRLAVNSLKSNLNVSTVMIKHHPRTRPEDADILDSDDVVEKIPEYPHLAIVPNSSIAIELMGCGIKVFQLFELDGIDRDYYKLVKNGITKEITLNDLKNSFWESNFFGKDWLVRFSYYEPSVLGLHEETKETLLLDLEHYIK